MDGLIVSLVLLLLTFSGLQHQITEVKKQVIDQDKEKYEYGFIKDIFCRRDKSSGRVTWRYKENKENKLDEWKDIDETTWPDFELEKEA